MTPVDLRFLDFFRVDGKWPIGLKTGNAICWLVLGGVTPTVGVSERIRFGTGLTDPPNTSNSVTESVIFRFFLFGVLPGDLLEDVWLITESLSSSSPGTVSDWSPTTPTSCTSWAWDSSCLVSVGERHTASGIVKSRLAEAANIGVVQLGDLSPLSDASSTSSSSASCESLKTLASIPFLPNFFLIRSLSLALFSISLCKKCTHHVQRTLRVSLLERF